MHSNQSANIAEANLSLVHSRSDLRNLIEEYFCAPADDLSETDSDSGSDDDDDEEAEREVPAAAAAAESDSEEEGESVDDVSVGLNSSGHDQLQYQYVRPDCTIKEARQQEKRPPEPETSYSFEAQPVCRETFKFMHYV